MRKQLVRKKVLFVLSVDTEEEFDWGDDFPQENCSIENVSCLPAFQDFCASLGVRPTYLVDYPVAASEQSAAIMRDIAQSGQVEIGAHLHPWCTPPFEGANTDRESHVVNLPLDLVRRKLDRLTTVIQHNIGVTPKVFRTGRWGVSGPVLRILAEAGYRVDSSVYPYYANEYFSCLDALDCPYWPDFYNADRLGAQRSIFELPITAGFNRTGFPFWGKVHRLLSAPVLRPLRLVGIAWRTGLLRKIYLSPELTAVADMKSLISAALADDYPVLHLFLHSSSLLPGRNEYTLDDSDRDGLYSSISSVVSYACREADVTFCTFSEAALELALDKSKI